MKVAAVADLTSLAEDLSFAQQKGIDQAAQEIITQTAQLVQAEAQTRAPVKTGRLRESISIAYNKPLTATIGPKVDYGVYQEFGTGERGEFAGTAYEIKPKKQGGTLRFKVGSKTVYTRLVRHPGIRPRRYMRNGLQAAIGQAMTDKLLKAGALLITKGDKA